MRLPDVRPVPGQSLTASQQRWRRAKRYRLLYLLLLFPLASLFIFDYIPPGPLAYPPQPDRTHVPPKPSLIRGRPARP